MIQLQLKENVICNATPFLLENGRKIQMTRPLPQVHARHICFNSLVEELRVGLSHGSIYTMARAWERYCEMLQTDFNVLVDKCDRDNRKNFQNKMKRSLCGKADFVQSLDPQEALLVFP